MIQATLRMNFAPQKFEEAIQILQAIIERTKAEVGCMSCSVFQDRGNEGLIIYEEKWRNYDDLQRHLRSDEYQNILLVMEMATKKPEIRFDTIIDSSGVEIIEKARTKK
jgi:quinol monooxygenase YgiN